MADGYISQIKTPDNKVYLLKDSEKTDEKVAQVGNAEDKEFPIILKNTDNTTDETANVKYSNNVTTDATATKPFTFNPSTGTLKVTQIKIGTKDDSKGLFPVLHNWNQIGASNLYWYRSYISNYYGGRSHVDNWDSGKNIGTAATSSAAATKGTVNFYNSAAANTTQTKTLLEANANTNSNITITLPSSTGTLALTSQIPTNLNQLTNGPGYVTSSGITSVTIGATSPVQSSTSTAQTGSSASTTISLKDAYGDTKNPYGAKAKNLVLAGPSSGSNAAPTFRALVAADIPALSYVPTKTGPDDVNTMYNTGIYNVTSGQAANAPKGYKYGQLLVMSYRKHTGNTTTDWASQIYLHNGGGTETGSATSPGNVLYYRTSNSSSSNSWFSWQKAVHTDAAYTKVGDTNKPVYIAEDGTATAISYTIAKSVPADAVFTDTNKYHKTGSWGGTNNLTYTATAVNSADALAFTLPTASTSIYGATKLSSATDSSSEALAATPKAVKIAYDQATTALNTANNLLATADALVFKGTLGTGGTATAVPTGGYQAGWTYKIITAGTWAGQVCEEGDLLIAISDAADGQTAVNNAHWTVVQENINGYIHFYNNHDNDIDSLIPTPYLQTAALSGGAWSGTKPSNSHNGVAVFNFQTHSGHYYTQLALDTHQNRLWIRSADSATTFGNWVKIATTADIDALDGNLNSTTPGAGKTLTAFSQTNGKVSATFGNISITESQISDLKSYLPLSGGTMTGHIFMGGSNASSSTANTTQLVFGTSATQHIAITSNDKAFILNPSTSSTTNQIVLYLNKKSKFPSGIEGDVTGNLTGTATNANNLLQNTRMDYGWSGINYFNISAANQNAVKVNDTPFASATWTHILRFNHANNSGYYTDLAIPFNKNGIYYKRIIGGTLANNTTNGGWIEVLDILNYSSYAYALDGSNTGTKLQISTQIAAYTNGIQFMNSTTKKGSIGTDNNGTIGIYGTKVVLRPQLDSSAKGVEVTTDAMYPTASITLGTDSKKWSTVYATTFDGNATSADSAKWFMNRGGSTVTISDGPWAHGQAGYGGTNAATVWHQRWKQSGLTYTPSGGSATTLTDSGDMVLWLAQSATANTLTVNMAIDGIIYAMGGFKGNLTGNASTATKSGVTGIWLYPENSNEINFGGTNTSATLYIGYRTKDSRPLPTKFVFGGSTGTADLQVKTVYLGSGVNSYISSTQYTGNANTATTATYLSNIGRQTNMDIDFGTTTYNSKVFLSYADGSTTTNKPSSNSMIFNVAWDNQSNNHYGAQIALHNQSTPHLQLRGCTNGTWDTSWLTVLDSNNYTNYTVTKTGTGASGTWAININGSISRRTTLTKGTNPSSTTWPSSWFNFQTGSGAGTADRIGGGIESSIDTNGTTSLQLRAYQYTANSTNNNCLEIIQNKDGTQTYRVSSPANFRSAIDAAASSHTHPVSQLTWPGSTNLTTSATGNGQEWSIDLTPGTHTGTYWQVWSGKNSETILSCYTDDNSVRIPNGSIYYNDHSTIDGHIKYQHISGSVSTAANTWYRIAISNSASVADASGTFEIRHTNAGSPDALKLEAGIMYHNQPFIIQLYNSSWSGPKMTKARITYKQNYGNQKAYLEVLFSSAITWDYDLTFTGRNWSLQEPSATTEALTENLNKSYTINLAYETIVSAKFAGNLTGNVTGNVSGSSGSCTGNAATATKVYVTNTTPTSATVYYLAYTNSTTSSNQDLRNTARLYYYDTGTASYLNIGNASNNGGLTLRNSNGKYVNIVTQAFSDNHSITLPDATGTIALTSSDITGTAANVTGTVAIDHGGTNATTAAGARTNLGLGSMATETATNYMKWQTTSSTSTALYNFGAYCAQNTAAGTGPNGSNYYNLINIPYRKASGNTKADWGWQLGNTTSNDNRMYYRTSGDNVWGDWQTIAHATTSSSNIGSATQPVYMTSTGVITAGTALGASAYHDDSYFALASHGTHVTTATVQSALSISSSGSATKALTEKGTFVTFGTSNLTIGTTATTAMAGNTTVTNVSISADTTTNKEYALVFGTTASDGTNPTAAKTEGLQKNITKLYTNPSTGTLYSTKFCIDEHVTLQYNTTDSSLEFVFA